MLVYARGHVSPYKLTQLEFFFRVVAIPNLDVVAVGLEHLTALGGYDYRATVLGSRPLHPRPHQRRLSAQQWHSLPLHIGAGQRPHRIVVLQERD